MKSLGITEVLGRNDLYDNLNTDNAFVYSIRKDGDEYICDTLIIPINVSKDELFWCDCDVMARECYPPKNVTDEKVCLVVDDSGGDRVYNVVLMVYYNEISWSGCSEEQNQYSLNKDYHPNEKDKIKIHEAIKRIYENIS